MDQVKIGRFIANCRKEKGLTQMQLAEKLNITDRAVSKWETGRAMPDSSIMLQLCQILGISVNDLLCGERVTMDKYDKELENNLLEMVKQKQEADRRLLSIEVLVGAICLIFLLALTIFVSFVEMQESLKAALILIGLAPLLIATPFMLKIEQIAGYYECKHCHHKYVPKYSAVFFAPHVGRTRHMKCPECGKICWHKKVISKDE